METRIIGSQAGAWGERPIPIYQANKFTNNQTCSRRNHEAAKIMARLTRRRR